VNDLLISLIICVVSDVWKYHAVFRCWHELFHLYTVHTGVEKFPLAPCDTLKVFDDAELFVYDLCEHEKCYSSEEVHDCENVERHR